MTSKETACEPKETKVSVWQAQYPQDKQPTELEISAFVSNPLWDALCEHLTQAYAARQSIAYSRCSAAPGWNVKFQKGGRALCTLYPHYGYYTCLVTADERVSAELELALDGLTEEVRTVYRASRPMNGARWLMIDVTSQFVFEDVKTLIKLKTAQSAR